MSELVPPSLPDQLSVCLLQKSVYRVYVIGLTEITLCPNPNRIGPTELHVSPTENSNVHILNHIGLTEFLDSVPPNLVNCV